MYINAKLNTLLDLKGKSRFVSTVLDARILRLSESVAATPRGHHILLYAMEGTVKLRILDQYSNAVFISKKMEKKSCYYISSTAEYELSPQEGECAVMILRFDLYRIFDTTAELDGLIAEPVTLPVFPQLNMFRPDIENFIHILVGAVRDYADNTMLISSLLDSLLELYIDEQTRFINSVLANVSAVVFESAFQQPEELTLEFKNVEIWSENPEASPRAKLIYKTLVRHKFIESPSESQYSFKEEEETGILSVCGGSTYKLWFFAGIDEAGMAPSIDLTSFRSTCFIRFSVKSSLDTQIRFSLYNIPNGYRSISHIVDVQADGCWQTYSLSLIHNFSEKPVAGHVQTAINYIRQHYARKLTVQEIADHVHIHPSHLNTLFQQSIDQSVNKFLIFCRIKRVKELLTHSTMSIERISAETGFSDQHHLAKTFRKHVGMSPSEYKKSFSKTYNKKAEEKC